MAEGLRARGAKKAKEPPPKVGTAEAHPQAQEVTPAKPPDADATKFHMVLPFFILCGHRFAAAWSNPIADCDETFNYWEPAHFLAFGHGFQTWEYSPAYALRSYLFLQPHTQLMRLLAEFVGRPNAFFFVRAAQGFLSAAAELTFAVSIGRRFGWEVGTLTLWLLALSPGTWVASVAFLPSSITMLLVCLVWASWLSQRHCLAIGLGALAVVVVWPFAGLLFVPLGLSALGQRPVTALAAAVSSFALWGLLSWQVDSSFYGKSVLPAFEILRYNVLDRSKKGGAELYGVEPWYFYLVNGLLNLTVALPAAAALPFLSLLRAFQGNALQQRAVQAYGYSLSALIWVTFFSNIPHKEERFLAPAYPLILFAAAVAVYEVTDLISSAALILPKTLGQPLARLLRALVPAVFLFAAATSSLSRITALQTGYAAPVNIYRALSQELSSAPFTADPRHVCVGSEWYRFMTSFFLPKEQDHLSYIRFGPTGLLPAEWNATLGTRGIPPNMNDLNQEETSRYIKPELCSYFIDMEAAGDEGDVGALRLRAKKDGRLLAEAPFLDAGRSKLPWRAFYVPTLSDEKNVYSSYKLWKLSP